MMEERQKSILEELKKMIDEMDHETVMVNNEDTDGHDMVFAQHTDMGVDNETVIGQYCFVPSIHVEGMDRAPMDLMMELILPAMVGKKTLLPTRTAMVDLNLILPMGSFVVSMEGDSIAYRNVVTLWDNMSEAEIRNMIHLELATSLATCYRFMDPISDLSEGRISYEDFLEFLDEVADLG